MSEEARRLADDHGGVWGEHPDHPVGDWRHEVSDDETRTSYRDWVLQRLEED